MDGDEEIRKQDDEDEVKSRAVVKYSAPKPATFTKLQFNTDLNLPPSNWLSSSADSYGLQKVVSHQKGFSSFRMAHMFPDCVGEVDVVSDAENIKNLLKIPYYKGHISMMVHRVENTLLIDEFDIYKHLLKTSETEWEWLKKFFFENINRETYEGDRHLYIKNRTQKALKQKSLISKFLYHSLVEDDNADNQRNSSNERPLLDYTLQTPQLPDPSPNTECPDQQPFDSQFNRNVVWTFEDIEMLLGTDMPIFGGGTHPCISLRLRDMNKPISVLTGIDYWLDNLMSNVPEVVMCYHLNGIVQKYELIKTEDLPRLDNSKFSPKLIRDVAQSILSFLKSNATKAGHTYWLFKGKDEEVIKLYDLTSLCSEEDVQKDQNPFTIPVAMLLYRVARNMKHSLDRRPQPGTIRMLLKNCIKLLPEERYPEIVTSSHYMLSDLYVPAGIDPQCPDFDQMQRECDDSNSVYDDDLNDGDSVAVLDLDKCDDNDKFTNHYKPPPPIIGSVEERCLQAIEHVAGGLNCLQYFNEEGKTENKTSQKQQCEVDNIPMANPYEAIPMPYAKLNEDKPSPTSTLSSKRSKKRDKKRKASVEHEIEKVKEEPRALLPKNKNEARPAWPTVDDGAISWKQHLKTLLLEKAILVYACLIEHCFLQNRFGSALRTLALLTRCQLALDRLQKVSRTQRLSCLIGRAGEACLMTVQNWKEVDSYREQLHSHRDEDVRLLEMLEQDEQSNRVNLGDGDARCVFVPDIRTMEQMLVKTVECYERAHKMAPSESLSYRLANSLNELGSYLLNVAKQAKTSEDIVSSCNKSEPYLSRSLQIFEQVNNDANIALVNMNIAHLYRLLAFAHTPKERGELSPLERKYYNKALESYRRALRVLGERKSCPGVWDAVTWELSTALFTISCIMYDNPPSDVSKSEAEKQILESLHKALDQCDLDESNPKYPLYQYRAATLNFRIGSLWSGHVWGNSPDAKRHAAQLADRYYERAVKFFLLSDDVGPYFTTQLQRLSINELLHEGSPAPNVKLKHLHACMEIFVEFDEMFQHLVDKKAEVPAEPGAEGIPNALNSLLKMVKDRLQRVLKSLLRLLGSKPGPIKESAKLLEIYKACYVATFQLSSSLERDRLLQVLHKAIKDIKDVLKRGKLI